MLHSQYFCLTSSFLSIDRYKNMRFHCGLLELSVFAWKLFCEWYISTFKPSRRTVLGDRHRFVMELISETYSEVRRPLNNIPEDTSLLGLSLARGWKGACFVGTVPSRENDQPAGKWTMYFSIWRDASTVHVFATCTAKEINDRFSRSVGIVYSWLLKSSCARCWI